MSVYYSGRSLLIVACGRGHTDTTQLLIDTGANVNKIEWVSASNDILFAHTLEI